MIWGLSKPIDFMKLLNRERIIKVQDEDDMNDKPISILLLGSGDLRHVLQTASRIARSGYNQKYHFYILETQSTILARHMLHLSIIDDQCLENNWNGLEGQGLKDRADLFLECFGNLMVREKTAQFIRNSATSLIRVVTDESSPLNRLLNFSNLTFRERDDLEFVFKFWRDDTRAFDGPTLWDNRLRILLGRRFDSRENIFDWDYNMKFLERDKYATIVHKSEYTRWRMNGNFHEVRESQYHFSNRTMATVDEITLKGEKRARWGLFSDIVVGPFISFSIETEHVKYLEKANDKHQYPSQLIAEMNVKSIIHELNTGQIYDPDTVPTIADSSMENCASNFLPIEKIQIFFLPCDPERTLVKKKVKYDTFFDAAFISSSMAHRLGDVAPLIKPDGVVIVEPAQMMLDLTLEQVAAYTDKVNELSGPMLSKMENCRFLKVKKQVL